MRGFCQIAMAKLAAVDPDAPSQKEAQRGILTLTDRPLEVFECLRDQILRLLNWQASGPADRLETAQLFFVHALNAAKDRIWIATPYFVPDEAVMTALQLATLRGVAVRVILPKKPDSYAVWLASFWYIEELADDDVRFYHYEEGFMHQKVMLVDDYWSAVGTANFDIRSFRLNFEITVAVVDKNFAANVEKMLSRDFQHSRQVTADELHRRSFWFRLAVRSSRLLAPIQ